MTDIPHYDRAPLCLLTCQRDGSELPPRLVEEYWRARRMVSRLGNAGPMPANVLVTVGLLAGIGQADPSEAEPNDFGALCRRGEIKKNDRIEVEWRGERREATFLGLRHDGNVEFLLDTDKRPRTVAPDKAQVLAVAG